MKRHHFVVAAITIAIVTFFLIGRRHTAPVPTPLPEPPPVASPTPATKPASEVTPSPAPPRATPIAASPASPASPAPVVAMATPPRPPGPRPSIDPYNPPLPEGYPDVEKTKQMLKDYRTVFGENPFGTNAEIMKSIMGGNRKGAMLGPPEGMSLNGAGELVDHWGTPIFFHQLSKDAMEVRSAGEDRVMWTGDDVILK